MKIGDLKILQSFGLRGIIINGGLCVLPVLMNIILPVLRQLMKNFVVR